MVYRHNFRVLGFLLSSSFPYVQREILAARMIQVVCLLLLFSVLGQTLATDCTDVSEVDGCNTWGLTPYKSRFTPACYKHDVCYACGADRGVSRYTCDHRFRDNMRAICDRNWICNLAAEGYYGDARRYNWSLNFFPYNYQEPSASWCNATWVDDCM